MLSYLLLPVVVVLIAHIIVPITAAIDDAFLQQANSTLSTLREKCMHSWLYENPQRPMKFPAHYIFPRDAHEHSARLKAIAGRFRHIPPHEYAGYSGPWVENIWIKNFEHLPVEAFGGMIPLFFNWVDGQLKDQMNMMISVLTPVIRPNVLYVTVSQSDESIHKLMILHPNILVLSAGGFGHVPLPLIKGEADYRPPPSSFLHDVAFIGTDREERHELIIKALESAAKVGFSTTNTFVKEWKDQIYGTKFNLSPRGYGRSSFRFSEIIQMGRIPIHLYNDISWVPYVGTNISLNHYGFEANVASIPSLMTKLKALSNETLYEMFQKIAEVRPYYTYEGVMGQIKLFLGDPLGPNGGYLRCTKVPRTVLCCGRR